MSAACEDSEQFFEMFAEECMESLKDWEETVLGIEKQPNLEFLNRLFRVAHNIKGAANSLGHIHLGHFVHLIEDMINPIRDNLSLLSSAHIECFFKIQSDILAWIKNFKTSGDQKAVFLNSETKIKELIKSINAVESDEVEIEIRDPLFINNIQNIIETKFRFLLKAPPNSSLEGSQGVKIDSNNTYLVKVYSEDIDTAGIQFLVSLKKCSNNLFIEIKNGELTKKLKLLGVKSCLLQKKQ